MAKVKVSDWWKIESDERCWIVCELVGERRAKSKSELAEHGEDARLPNWTHRSFHESLEQAAESLRKRLLRASEADGMDAVEIEDARIRAVLDDIVKRAGAIAA